MSRNPHYIKMINSNKWKLLRAKKLQPVWKCAKRTIAVHLQPKYIIPSRLSPSHELGMRQLMFDYNNLQSLCHSCHSDAHRRAFSHSRGDTGE